MNRLTRLSVALLFVACLPFGTAEAKPVSSRLAQGLDVIYEDYLLSSGAITESSQSRSAVAEAAAGYRQWAVTDGGGRYRVLINLTGDKSLDATVAALTATRKFEVVGTSTRYRHGLIDGWLSIEGAGAVSKVKGIAAIALQTMPVTNVGSVTQEGLNRHRVDQINGLYDGTGITIGVMSDSFDNTTSFSIHAAQDIASGDLPGAGNPAGNLTPVEVIEERPILGTDEGRAMLQLVHDMAPKAKLGFATAGLSQLQFADNIRSLANYPGAPRAVPGFTADIIVDDVIFLTENMFSDGIVAQAVNDVTAAGVHYFSSAGNRNASQAYTGTFNPVSGGGAVTGTNINLAGVDPALYAGGFHNFRNDGGQDIAQTIRRTSGTGSSNARFVMEWDDPFDLVTPGTLISSTDSTFVATPVDIPVSLTQGVPTRIAVTAIHDSGFDAIITILDPSMNVVLGPQDTDTDETAFFTPTTTGTYTVRVDHFSTTTGDFNVSAYANSSVGVTTEYNVLWFRSDTGAFITATPSSAFAINQPVVFASSIPIPTGQNTVQMVIARSQGSGAERLKYLFFDGSTSAVRPDEYFSYQTPVTYGHSSTARGHGVAAMSAFRPYIPESFTSPGPVTILFDADGNRLAEPEIRQQPKLTAMDGGNTTFFLSDNQGDFDGTPNFFGTSAAAPNAAAVAALVLQAHGGPGSLTTDQMTNILINSTMPNDLDPQNAFAVVKTNGGWLTVTVNADYTNNSATTTVLPLVDPNVFRVGYFGQGSVASVTLDGTNANVTGGNVGVGVAPGMVFDGRPIASSGLPFTLGALQGLVNTDITALLGATAPSPAVAGMSHVLNLTFAPFSFRNDNDFGFNIDRDELRIFAVEDGSAAHNPVTFGPQIGNSADLLGGGVEVPAGNVVAGGMTVTGTMQDGTTFTGLLRNRLGVGYSPLTGYGFLNAERAVALASNVTRLSVLLDGNGAGTVTSAPAAVTCSKGLGVNFTPLPGSVCTVDQPTNGSITLTATADAGSYFSGWLGCDTVVGADCTVSLPLPRPVEVTFTELTAPDSPVVTEAVAGNGSATISFESPIYNGGSAITSYTVTCNPDGHTASGAGSPITVNGLTNGQTYGCTVTATNAIGTSPPSSPPSEVTPVGEVGNGKARGDFDGNGTGDLFFHNADGSAAIWLMNGLATIGSGSLLGAGTAWDVAHIADLDGDGKSDLVWQNPDGSIAVYTMDGTTPTGTAQILNAGDGWTVTQAADLDGDGKSDLVFRHTDGTLAAWLMNGTAMTSGATILGAGSGWDIVKTGDFNDDGKTDLVFAHTDGRVAIWLMDGLTPTTQTQILNAGSGWHVNHIVDMNNDGKADIIWENDDGRVAIWLMDGTTMTTGGDILNAGSGWSVTRTGDFDGDDNADLLFTHTDGRVAIYLMNGLTPTTTTQILNAGSGWSAKRVADLDNDGKTDIVWENTDGRIAVWLMNGTAMSSGGEILGAGTGWTVSGVSQQ
jgi:hypothetical protein